MTLVECPREADVLEAVSMGRWPECGDAELIAHVASCSTCTEVAGISFALQGDRHSLTSAAPVPSSAIVWWRAQMRARTEAARTAARPITIMQTTGLVCGVVALAAVIAFTSPLFGRWFSDVSSLLPAVDASASTAPSDPSMLRWIWPLAIGVCAILGPLAVYFAMREES